MRKLKSVVVGLVLLGGAPANAHEFWLEPAQFSVVAGTPVAVSVCVGDGSETQVMTRDASRIEQFVAWGPAGPRDVVGRDGANPAGFVRFDEAGTHVIAYRSNRAFTAQTDTRFVAYLHEDGLEAILPLRAQQDQPDRLVRESYSRYAKALVRAGAGGAIVDRPVGLALELIAQSDLSLTAGDGQATFQLLHQGQPLAGALLKAMWLGEADTERAARTDTAGRASFRLDRPGPWRISAVHMTRPPAGVDAEWDSLWASLTFEVREEGGAARPQHDRSTCHQAQRVGG